MKKIFALSLAVLMLMSLAVCAFAIEGESPDKPGTEYKLTVIAGPGGTAEGKKNDDGTYTITAYPDDGHTFTGWELTGDYEIISGSLTDRVMVIRLKSDVVATASFDGKKPVKPWEDDKAPQTGNMILPVAFVAVVSLFGCAYAVKRSFSA